MSSDLCPSRLEGVGVWNDHFKKTGVIVGFVVSEKDRPSSVAEEGKTWRRNAYQRQRPLANGDHLKDEPFEKLCSKAASLGLSHTSELMGAVVILGGNRELVALQQGISETAKGDLGRLYPGDCFWGGYSETPLDL